MMRSVQVYEKIFTTQLKNNFFVINANQFLNFQNMNFKY
jgi:hypothetical protein